MSERCPHCGGILEPGQASKPRSAPQLRRFFALIRAAFHHWPAQHRFQPRNPEHLRAWLECEAGHCEVVKTIRCETVNPKVLTSVLTAVMRATEDDKTFIECEDERVIVKRALSISFPMLAHLAAGVLFDQISDLIKLETGIDPEHLIKEAEQAA